MLEINRAKCGEAFCPSSALPEDSSILYNSASAACLAVSENLLEAAIWDDSYFFVVGVVINNNCGTSLTLFF